MTAAHERARKLIERAAMRWYRQYADVDSASLEGTFPRAIVDIHRACAALAKEERK